MITLRRVLCVVFLLVFIGTLASYANDGLELIKAAEEGNIAKVRNLLAQGADVNTKDKDGYTALIHASMNGHTEVVKTLLAKGVDVNAKVAGEWNNGLTALMGASMNGHSEVVKILLAQGADVNAKAGGKTALMWASWAFQKGYYDKMVKALYPNDADVNPEAKKMAAELWETHYGEVERLLKKAGAKE